MDLDQLMTTQAQAIQADAPIHTGKVSRIVGSDVYVVVATLSPSHEYGPVRLAASTTLAEGDECLVVFDDQENPWALKSGTSAHTHPESDITGLVADLAARELTANKGAANGYAPLDSGLLVPVANLPVLNAIPAPTGDVSFNNHKGTNALDPTSAQDVATKNYVDTHVLTTVSALPSSPIDGQECYYLADATNGVVWHLKYRATSTSAYKWEFVGGARLVSAQRANVNATFTGGGAGGTTWGGFGSDPAVTVPLAGDYEVDNRCHVYSSTASPNDTLIGVRVGSTEPSASTAPVADPDQSRWMALGEEYVIAGVAANTTLTQRYQPYTTATLYRRAAVLAVRPVRVG